MIFFGLFDRLVVGLACLSLYLLSIWDDFQAIRCRLQTIEATPNQSQNPSPPTMFCVARCEDLQHKLPFHMKKHTHIRICTLTGKLLTPFTFLLSMESAGHYIENLHLELPLVAFIVMLMILNMFGPALIGNGSCKAGKDKFMFMLLIAHFFTPLVGASMRLSVIQIFPLAMPCAINIGGNLLMAWHRRSGERPCYWKD